MWHYYARLDESYNKNKEHKIEYIVTDKKVIQNQ